MPKDFSRTLRVADQVQRELASLIQNEIMDPRIGMITLTGVEVTRDYTYAKVFYTTLGGNENAQLAEEGLKRAAGFLRSQLAGKIRLRIIPKLQFVYDESIERGIKLSRLIDEAVGKT
ncbi:MULTISPECIES: 30S ribosome-binding factor RbfA [Nitrosomonas]|uniref:Ribosome-binding factor A n=2 Tax=Nitrosomonas eutropha TaxID=916 RepID=RBFA_NITEC|nr:MULTISPECIES: 30S ribosome-binding factor RbfA [Nitrosomonas]Q0AFJ4.1 RecName: Full=Ribosome-binding factor A [Nitrosomonas eutropha C91]ABI59888.1 ribosome-binding factor A [Nitrosomonas eutropha C91]MXS80386.1 30S ribosome-binding factor RbfA [Nitrosomonas sp. GH22]PXV80110.1 ribosome-binding factor A [Nitrosomonas eutropha]SCX21234.1 ribosome-binding factor A [Nitrosomonas eutropha]SDW77076.1 ribosome-binding factor A [Nitrosomonas eutropha]